MKKSFASGAIWLALTGNAFAFCPAPGAAPKPPQSSEKPRPPSCLANASGEENVCTTAELDRYSRDVEDYIKKLDDYVFAAERYADDAAKYAACEADEARESLGQ